MDGFGKGFGWLNLSYEEVFQSFSSTLIMLIKAGLGILMRWRRYLRRWYGVRFLLLLFLLLVLALIRQHHIKVRGISYWIRHFRHFWVPWIALNWWFSLTVLALLWVVASLMTLNATLSFEWGRWLLYLTLIYLLWWILIKLTWIIWLRGRLLRCRGWALSLCKNLFNVLHVTLNCRFLLLNHWRFETLLFPLLNDFGAWGRSLDLDWFGFNLWGCILRLLHIFASLFRFLDLNWFHFFVYHCLFQWLFCNLFFRICVLLFLICFLSFLVFLFSSIHLIIFCIILKLIIFNDRSWLFQIAFFDIFIFY